MLNERKRTICSSGCGKMLTEEQQKLRQKFYAHGHYLNHKQEIKDRSKKWAEEHPIERRVIRLKNSRKHPEYFNNWAREHPEERNESTRKWALENPEKKNAEQQAWRHCPLGPCCQFGGCGSTEKLQRAHIDYSKPLEVLTFCAKHHKLIDALYKEND